MRCSKIMKIRPFFFYEFSLAITMVLNFSFRKISATTEITEIHWISVISVYVSAKWLNFCPKIHLNIQNSLKYFKYFLNSCVVLKVLKYFDRKAIISGSTEITEIQWISMKSHWILKPWLQPYCTCSWFSFCIHGAAFVPQPCVRLVLTILWSWHPVTSDLALLSI